MNVEEMLKIKGIPYEDRGENVKLHCLNPHHNDKNPSLEIRKSDGLFHCWSCGFSGNIYTLQKLLFGKDNIIFKINPIQVSKSKKYKKSYPTIKIIGELQNPFNNLEVMKFLRSIGITRDEFIHKYEIKYSIYTEMIADNLREDIETNFTKMQERVCIPIYHNSKLINMECRTYKGDTPKVKYVKGGSVNTLFNWQNIDKSKTVVTTESVKNFCKIWNVYPNTVALFHNIPTDKQLKMLNECNSIIHFGDNDEGFFGNDKRDGTLQRLAKNYKGKLFLTWDKREYYKEVDGEKKKIGYDANDCSLAEISNHLDNAISFEEYQKNSKVLWR